MGRERPLRLLRSVASLLRYAALRCRRFCRNAPAKYRIARYARLVQSGSIGIGNPAFRRFAPGRLSICKFFGIVVLTPLARRQALRA